MTSTAKKRKVTPTTIEVDDIPELTAAQWKTARRGVGRGVGRRLELPLEGARRAFAKTQVEVSRATGMAQADVSRIENSAALDEVQVGTLRRFVAGLGAELELTIVGPDGSRIVVRGAGSKRAPLVKAREKVRASSAAKTRARRARSR